MLKFFAMDESVVNKIYFPVSCLQTRLEFLVILFIAVIYGLYSNAKMQF